MSSFTRFHKPATQPKQLVDEEKCQQVTKVKTPGELLNTPLRAALCIDIKNKANAPEGVFQQYYKALIDIVAEFYQDLPGITPPFNRCGGLLDNALQRAAQMLEERLNHRFPEEGSDQQVAEEYALWTYMLFTVALFRDIGKLHNCYQVYLCDSEGLMPRRWMPYDGAIPQHSQYYRFKQIDTDRRHIDPSQWDKRAGPNLAYKLMTTEQFNWIHGNAAAYRIWWYELGDEEEEGRGGKGTKLAIDNAETAAIKIAMTMDNDAAIKAFADKVQAAEAQQENMKNLPSLEMDPSAVNVESTVEVTMAEWAAQVSQSDSAMAKQVQTNKDGTISISAAAVEAFAQSFPQLAQQSGGAGGIYNQVSASAANTASVKATAPVTTVTASASSTAAQTTASPTSNTPLSAQSGASQVGAQMSNIVAKAAAGGAMAAAVAAAASYPAVQSTSSSVTLSLGR
jgi:hypothetical protein